MSLRILSPEVEHRMILKFLCKFGTSKDAAITEIMTNYKNVNVTSLQQWWKRFEQGEEEVYDEGSALIRDMYTFIRNNSLVSVEMVVAKFRIPEVAIRRVLEKMSLKPYIGRIVPCSLSNVEKRVRLNFCKDMLDIVRINSDKSFPQDLIMVQQMWLFKYEHCQDTSQDQSNTIQSMIDIRNDSLPMLEGKKMSVALVDVDGVISHELIPEDKILTGDYYLRFIERIVMKLRKLAKYQHQPLYLLFEDRPPQNSIAVRRLCARNKIIAIYHPLNALDIVPFQHHMYLKIREGLMYQKENTEDVVETILTTFYDQYVTLHNSLLQWEHNMSKCVAKEGDYLLD